MLQVKKFSDTGSMAGSGPDGDGRLNNFLRSLDEDQIVDIQFQVHQGSGAQYAHYHYLVTYRPKEEE